MVLQTSVHIKQKRDATKNTITEWITMDSRQTYIHTGFQPSLLWHEVTVRYTDILIQTCVRTRSHCNVAAVLCCNHWLVWHQPTEFSYQTSNKRLAAAKCQTETDASGPYTDNQPEEMRVGSQFSWFIGTDKTVTNIWIQFQRKKSPIWFLKPATYH
jgi:hypothetical protein